MKHLAVITLIPVFALAATAFAGDWQMQPVQIRTQWATNVTPEHPLPEYPRPQLVRRNWENLNGLWQYAITPAGADTPTGFHGQILVPYPVESALSGVRKQLRPDHILWYKRTFTIKAREGGQRTLIHFGAVDNQATVYVNDREAGTHIGGYQSFDFDITDFIRVGLNTLVLKVFDPSDTGSNPHGKQTLKPEGIGYTATSGIWQTVWLERVPNTYISQLKITPDVDGGKVYIQAALVGDKSQFVVEAIVSNGTKLTPAVTAKDGLVTMHIDDAHLWSPNDPFLYELRVYVRKGSEIEDEVRSYFGMRKVELKKDSAGFFRIFLNNKYVYNLGTLDQGYWPESLYTAPTEAALKFDIETIKSMGFNTVRKHVKVETDRWYYHCDKEGLLVWQDMVPPANDSTEARRQFELETGENVAQLYNHPSIIMWVLFNEGWGAYDQQRLERWVKQLDPSRLVSGHSGASMISNTGAEYAVGFSGDASDVNDYHTYPDPVLRVVNPEKAQVIGEYGGIEVPVVGHVWSPVGEGWGYAKMNQRDLVTKYREMLGKLKTLETRGLAASIYTQPYDVETELNGLMTYDRAVIKIPVGLLNEMNRALVPSAARYTAGR